MRFVIVVLLTVPRGCYGRVMLLQQTALAGFFPRSAAFLFDLFVLLAVEFMTRLLHLPLEILVWPAYAVYCWSQRDGQTLGMQVFGIRVVCIDGSSITLRTAVIRCLGLLLSSVPLCLGVIWAAIDPQRQGWHDKLARTYVVTAVQEIV